MQTPANVVRVHVCTPVLPITLLTDMVARCRLLAAWHGMVDVCDGYLAAEASGPQLHMALGRAYR